MPTYLSPSAVPSCVCRSRREQDACPYGHPDECHYSLSCTQAACGRVYEMGYSREEVQSVAERSRRLIASLSSHACRECGGAGLLEHRRERELLGQTIRLTFAQICRCVIAAQRMGASNRRAASATRPEPTAPTAQDAPSRAFSPEIDLHGRTVADALEAIETFLRSALNNHHVQVSIIHGKGRGILRDALRDHLHTHPLVEEYSSDTEDAVVFATLRNTR